MANLNQYKLVKQKCELYYKIMENEIGKKIIIKKESDKPRFGFYLYMLECLSNIKDTNLLIEKITDTDFNKIVYGDISNDCGIDAVNIDEDSKIINLFNFKYRENFNEDKKQSKNDVFISTKFVNAIMNGNTEHLEGKIKKFADEIVEKNNSNDIWKMVLYMVTNENQRLESDDSDVEQLKELYDLEVKTIILDDIVNFMSKRPEPICSQLVLEKEAVLSYTESSLVSAKSYLIKIPVTELIRITCQDNLLRDSYNIEDIAPLVNVGMDFDILFDNVRGFLGDTKYNVNILKTLKKEPTKFFMYNNGVTITAEDITSKEINGRKKLLINIKNFQVVNGGQTLRSIYIFKELDSDNLENFLCDAEILVRIFKTGEQDDLSRKIAEYTNSQNAISAIDLKSITTEQLEIEQVLNDNDIIYARKIGDTGIEEKDYKHKISLEKFAQILFSIQGNPDKASNQKKKIFEKYYDKIFGEKNFDISKAPEIVILYYNIKNLYESRKEYESSDQKIFYIIYLYYNGKNDIDNNIVKLEQLLNEYSKTSALSQARALITAGFKKSLDESFNIVVK